MEQMKEKLEELARKPRDRESWNDEAVEELEEHRAWRLLQEGARRLGHASVKKICGSDRFLLGLWIRSRVAVSVKWLADQLGLRTRGGMSRSLYLAKQRLKSDRTFQKKWSRLDYDNNWIDPFFNSMLSNLISKGLTPLPEFSINPFPAQPFRASPVAASKPSSAAPAILEQFFSRTQTPGPDRIQMNVITDH